MTGIPHWSCQLYFDGNQTLFIPDCNLYTFQLKDEEKTQMIKLEFTLPEKKKMYVQEMFNMTIQYKDRNIFSFIIKANTEKDNDLTDLDREWMEQCNIIQNPSDSIVKSSSLSLTTSIFIHFTADTGKKSPQKWLHKIYVVGNRDEIYHVVGTSLHQQ